MKLKKLLSALLGTALVAALLAGCGGSSSTASSDASSSAASSTAVSSETSDSSASDTADTAKLDSIVSAIEAVNEVPNPLAYDDFTLENDLMLTMDNIVAFKGDVTNTQSDCALVLAIQAKDGAADQVKAELEAYKERLAGDNLYIEFADKTAKAADARVVANGNFVVMVIAGVNGADYADIDTAIQNALA